MKYKVLALKEMDPLGHKILEQIGAEALTAPETASEEEILDLIAKNQVDAIYSRTDKVDRAMMNASPRLKVVAKQGVGLDVFEQEPLPLSSELFTMENVVLTPPPHGGQHQPERQELHLSGLPGHGGRPAGTPAHLQPGKPVLNPEFLKRKS